MSVTASTATAIAGGWLLCELLVRARKKMRSSMLKKASAASAKYETENVGLKGGALRGDKNMGTAEADRKTRNELFRELEINYIEYFARWGV